MSDYAKATTVEDIFAIQAQQLADWKLRLNSACYAHLAKVVEGENAKFKPLYASGQVNMYDVFRGDMMYAEIANWTPPEPVVADEPERPLGGPSREGTKRLGGIPVMICPCCENKVPSVSSVHCDKLGLTGHCAPCICNACQHRASMAGTYARCFVICETRGIVIQRRGRIIEIDNNKGTTAECAGVAEACQTLCYDPAFGGN